MNNTETQPNIEPAVIVRTARAAYSWTQEVLAQEADVALSTIRRLERGEMPSVRTARRVADAIGVEVDLLIPASPVAPQEGHGITPSPPTEKELSRATQQATDRPDRSPNPN